MRLLSFSILFALATQLPAQVLTASKILSGSGQDTASAVAVDRQGNVFVAGTTTSGDFPIVNGLISRIPDAGLRISTDGRTFRASTLLPASVSALASTPDGKVVLAAAPDGIYRSVDGGMSWTGPQTVSGQVIALAIDPVNPANAYAVARLSVDTVFDRSADGGITWQQVSKFALPPWLPRIVIDPQNPTTIYASFSFLLYRSDDSGNNWQIVAVPAAFSPVGQTTPRAFAIAPSQPQTFYAATYDQLAPESNGTLLKSVDRGVTWVAAGAIAPPTLACCLAIDPQDPNVLWFANTSGIQRTVDGGASIQSVLKIDGDNWTSIAVDPTNSSHIFAAGSQRVYSSLDGGATWNVVASGQFTALLATPLAVLAAAQVTPALYVAKLDAALKRILFSTFIGAASGNIGIAVDSEGNALVTGVTQALDFPITANALNRTFSAKSAGFAVKVPGDGSRLIYSTFLNDLAPLAAALDSAGNAVIVGAAQGPAQGSPQAYQPASPGPCTQGRLVPTGHAFAVKLSADGTALAWGTYLSGSCGDSANAVQLDSSGNAYITGTTASRDFPVTQDAMTATFPGLKSSGFVSEVSADGSRLLYSSFFGAGANNGGNAIVLDGRGNVFLGGFTQADASAGAVSATHAAGCQPIVTPPGSDTSFQGNDGFVMKMTLSAAPASFLATLGGSCQDSVSSLTIDGAGNLWAGGTTASSDFPTIAPIGALGIGTGGFVAEIDRTGSSLLFSSFTGIGAAVADASTGVFLAGATVTESKANISSAIAEHIDASQVSPMALDSIQAPVPPLLAPQSFTVPGVAPGQLLVLKGRSIGPSSPVFAKLGTDGRLPFTLGGVQVLFDGVAAALFYVQANQIECQVPFEVDGSRSTNIQVRYQGQSSNSFAAAVVAQKVIILAGANSDGTLNSPSNPARIGSVATIYLSGVGQTNPKGIDGGVNASSGILPVAMPAVYVNSTFVNPAFLGAAPGQSSAVFQLNLQVPAPPGMSDNDAIYVLNGGMFSQAFIRLYAK